VKSQTFMEAQRPRVSRGNRRAQMLSGSVRLRDQVPIDMCTNATIPIRGQNRDVEDRD
jgi:hypothetical protein